MTQAAIEALDTHSIHRHMEENSVHQEEMVLGGRRIFVRYDDALVNEHWYKAAGKRLNTEMRFTGESEGIVIQLHHSDPDLLPRLIGEFRGHSYE